MENIKYLVFSGGGVKAYMLLGVFEILNSYLILNNIKGICGTSIGSIISFLITIGVNYNEIDELLEPIKFYKIIGIYYHLMFRKIISKLTYNSLLTTIDEDKIHNLKDFRINDYYTQINSKRFRKFINTYLKKKNIPEDINFLDLFLITKKELCIVCTDIYNKDYIVFSYKTVPFMKVYKALLASINLPYIFKCIQFNTDDFSNNVIPKIVQNKYFCDGGIYNNYPLHIFDDCLENESLFNKTLGFVITDTNFFDIKVYDKKYKLYNKDYYRSVEIKNTFQIKTIQFLSNNEKKNLLKIGKRSMINYLNRYFFH
jgi:NTE family protein